MGRRAIIYFKNTTERADVMSPGRHSRTRKKFLERIRDDARRRICSPDGRIGDRRRQTTLFVFYCADVACCCLHEPHSFERDFQPGPARVSKQAALSLRQFAGSRTFCWTHRRHTSSSWLFLSTRLVGTMTRFVHSTPIDRRRHRIILVFVNFCDRRLWANRFLCTCVTEKDSGRVGLLQIAESSPRSFTKHACRAILKPLQRCGPWPVEQRRERQEGFDCQTSIGVGVSGRRFGRWCRADQFG